MLNSKDPIELFKEWLEAAKQAEINDPEAVCLATATKDGKPSSRMVLLKSIDERGFKFHTNETSQKGRELAQNPHAALCFHWKSLRRQINIEGTVTQTTDAEADEYFASRPRNRQIGAWASQQSSPLESREDLESKIKEYENKFEGQNIPRPPYWKGYILYPHTIEFWYDNPDRLHDRFVFTRNQDQSWSEPQRLSP